MPKNQKKFNREFDSLILAIARRQASELKCREAIDQMYGYWHEPDILAYNIKTPIREFCTICGETEFENGVIWKSRVFGMTCYSGGYAGVLLDGFSFFFAPNADDYEYGTAICVDCFLGNYMKNHQLSYCCNYLSNTNYNSIFEFHQKTKWLNRWSAHDWALYKKRFNVENEKKNPRS